MSEPVRILNRPPQVVYGRGAAAELQAPLADLVGDAGRLLIVADAVVVELGLVDPVIESVRAAGWETAVFAGVKAEPQVAVARDVLAAIERLDATAVAGIGGGSALDLAKIGAGVAAVGGDLDGALAGRVPLRRSLPLVAIPTTSGTGAECTNVAPIADGDEKLLVRGPGLMPDLAVLDATLTAQLPAAVTGATGMDALAHACEAFISTNATPFTDVYGLAAVRSIADSLVACCGPQPGLDDRETLLLAAHLAGTALNAGVVVGHSLAYALASRTHLPHGVTTGVLLPYALLYNRAAAEGRLAALGEAACGAADVDALVDWIAATITAVGLPSSLRETGLDRGELEGMATEVIERYPRPNNPIPLTVDRLLRFLDLAWEGDLQGAKDAGRERRDDV